MVLLKEFHVFLGHSDLHMENTGIIENRSYRKNRSQFATSSFRRRGVNISLKITSFAKETEGGQASLSQQ